MNKVWLKYMQGLAVGGNAGGDSDQDVVGMDGGSQSFIYSRIIGICRIGLISLICCWNDPGIP